MIRQCFILFGCLALGELVVMLTGIKMPSSIIGMLLLTLFLKTGVIKLEWVRGMTDFLIANLGFFFVPPGVALMLYFDIIKAEFWPIVGATFISTAIVLLITGHTHQAVEKGEKKINNKIQRHKKNVFVKPNEQSGACSSYAVARKRRMETNVFVKPNEQSGACSSYAVARKRRMKTNR